jgi:hypothetical protein
MNSEEIMEMAIEAEFVSPHGKPSDEESELFVCLDKDIYKFAKLVAAKEREACAKVCEDAISNIWEYDPEYAKQIGRNVCTNLATAIRARGEA